MANKNAKPPVEHQFKPGAEWRGNRAGGPKNLLTKDKLRFVLDKYMKMSKEEIIEMAKGPGTPMIELAIASILMKCVETGDYSRLEGLLQRHMGKVADEIIMPKPMVIRRPSGETVELTTQAALEGDDETRDND
jgi:hypothetical protein